MAEPISNLQFTYMNTAERRVLNLERVNLPSVPMLGYCHYRHPRPDVPEHWHPGCIEIHYGVRNTLSFGMNGRTYRLAPGELFVNQPGEHHTVSEHPKGLILYWLILRVTPIKGSFLQQPDADGMALRQALLNLPHHHFRGTERVKQLFRTLHMQVDDPASSLRDMRLRTTLLQLLLEVIDAAHNHHAPPSETRLAALIREMTDAPEKHYPLDILARRAGMAPSYVIARFREMTGLPPHQFLLDVRFRHAQRDLRESVIPITEIALRLNFCSSQHFANLFKRHTGVTPQAYRKGASGPSRISDRDDGQSRGAIISCSAAQCHAKSPSDRR